jgi:TPR repeat protein
MNTKKVTILLVITILLIFSVVSRIFFNEFQDGWNAYKKNDYKTARELWLPIAEQGEIRAQFFMGFMHDMGFGVPENDKEAIKWYQLAAEQGDARAQLFLGFLYDFGIGVPENDKEAIKWYQLAAEQGYNEAKINIIQLTNTNDLKIREDVFPPMVIQMMIPVLKYKAKKGSAEAQINLAIMHEFGLVVSQDTRQALYFYMLAAKQGYWAEENILKILRQNNPEEVKKIIVNANKGIAKSQYTLGMMYAEGQGVSQDKNKALKWYGHVAQQYAPLVQNILDRFKNKNIPQELKFLTNDAENGIAEAQLKLGMLYAHGQGVPQDDGRASKWLRLAGEQGKFKAQYILGMMLADGQGITKDYVLAHMWYNLSGLQGNLGATSQIKELEKSMSTEQIEQAQKMVREWQPSE